MYDWGLLGYLVRDVIGAHQEESFGIRQNHTMGLKDWQRLIHKHFMDAEYEMFVPERGWGERMVKRAASAGSYRSNWRAARLLGGTLAAVCQEGRPSAASCPSMNRSFKLSYAVRIVIARLTRDADDTLQCSRLRLSSSQ